MTVSNRRLVALALVVAGCSAEAPRPLPTKATIAPTAKGSGTQPSDDASSPKPRVVAAKQLTTGNHAERSVLPEAASGHGDEQAVRPRSSLADLAAAAIATEFALPTVDDGKVAAAGIRKLEGQHIVVYTDLPAAADVDELPQVFDAAVSHWCGYFGVDPAKVAAWKIIGSVMKERDRFAGAGLYPESLPDFPHGFNAGSQLWLYDQPSAYYRRHLLLHEGTHAFMLRWLGGAGPPWYMEGIAERLGTHRWEDGKLTLGIMPATRDEVPYWGRIKMIKDQTAASGGMSLIDIMRYDAHAHLKVEAYAWCWAATAFLDQHPLTQAAFRELKDNTRDRSIEFSKRFYERLKHDWPVIVEDWQLFVAGCDYGYDVPRAAVMRKAVVELPAAGATVTVATDRGWQSSGYRLEAGRIYRINASGRFQIAARPKLWPCEAGGVTIRYASGQPLGMLMAGVSDLDGDPPPITPLAQPQPIGRIGELQPAVRGTLFLKINEPAGGLADNVGTLSVTIRETK